MTFRSSVPAAALAACFLAACAPARANAPEAGPTALAVADTPGELPGVPLDGLTPEQRAAVLAFARESFCYCGCPHTLAQCLREHGTCRHARRMAALAVRLARAGVGKTELERLVASYYASFDRRAHLDLSGFGPPLGDPGAPMSLVEFSDFRCPFCRSFRPVLEEFVTARAARVKLFYKPFPIESHPGALDAAQAGEWARDQGLFWKMHDAMFESFEARSAEDLVDVARGIGGEPADLRQALEEGRYLAKVRASQAEARAAGIRGTPTLFLEGRMLLLPDFSEEGLDFTLQDEEEWQQHHGWERD